MYDMTIKGYKGRKIKIEERCQVYFNLHNHKFSVVQSGLVVAHKDGVVLSDVEFKVSKAGQRRVRDENVKNVHAKVHGNLLGFTNSLEYMSKDMKRAYYNPYTTDTFIDFETGSPIYEADSVVLFDKRIYYM